MPIVIIPTIDMVLVAKGDLHVSSQVQEKINDTFKDAKLKRKRSSYCYPTNHTTTTVSHSIRWIDSLLETPIEDHRKNAMWRIPTSPKGKRSRSQPTKTLKQGLRYGIP